MNGRLVFINGVEEIEITGIGGLNLQDIEDRQRLGEIVDDIEKHGNQSYFAVGDNMTNETALDIIRQQPDKVRKAIARYIQTSQIERDFEDDNFKELEYGAERLKSKLTQEITTGSPKERNKTTEKCLTALLNRGFNVYSNPSNKWVVWDAKHNTAVCVEDDINTAAQIAYQLVIDDLKETE